MKKITHDEFMNTPVKGRGRSSHVYNEISNLQPGEYLKIEKSDWKKSSRPIAFRATLLNVQAKNFNPFQCSITADGL